MRALILAGAALAASGCVYIDGDDDGGPNRGWSGRPGLVPLYASWVAPDGVHIRADSHGCTAEDSFNVVTYRDGGDPQSNTFHVRFERLAPDRCRAFLPDGVELAYSFTRLGLPADAVIIVDNPISR